jgi:HSP20 family molecular chaperone IbpA
MTMPFHSIHIIREFTDTGSDPSRSSRSLCSSSLKKTTVITWEPNADIFETDESVIIRIELAGVSKSNLTVKLQNGKLCIVGIRKEKKLNKKFFYHQLEISYGPFLKEILLPESLEHNDVVAHLQEGILEISISKNNQVIEIPIHQK